MTDSNAVTAEVEPSALSMLQGAKHRCSFTIADGDSEPIRLRNPDQLHVLNEAVFGEFSQNTLLYTSHFNFLFVEACEVDAAIFGIAELAGTWIIGKGTTRNIAVPPCPVQARGIVGYAIVG